MNTLIPTTVDPTQSPSGAERRFATAWLSTKFRRHRVLLARSIVTRALLVIPSHHIPEKELWLLA